MRIFLFILSNLLADGLVNLSNNSFESIWIVYCEICKNLTVNLDVCLMKCPDELRVAQTLKASSSVDTLNPKCTEITLFLTTVNVSISQAFFPCIFCYSPHILTCTIVTAG